MPVKNFCDCPSPPGGSVVCEPHQMAICGVINGVPRRECLDPPSGGTPTVLTEWAWSQISGQTASGQLTFRELRALRDGTFVDSKENIVKFVIPENIKSVVIALLEQMLDRSSGRAEM